MLSRLALVLVLGLVPAAFAQAAEDTFICSRNAPEWVEYRPGKLAAFNVRTVLAVDLQKKVATWATSGSSTYLEGKKTPNGVVVTRFVSSVFAREAITDVKQYLESMESSAPDWRKSFTFTMDDQFGGKGVAELVFSGRSLERLTSSGSGSWSNQGGDRETFDYCTTDVDANSG